MPSIANRTDLFFLKIEKGNIDSNPKGYYHVEAGKPAVDTKTLNFRVVVRVTHKKALFYFSISIYPNGFKLYISKNKNRLSGS